MKKVGLFLFVFFVVVTCSQAQQGEKQITLMVADSASGVTAQAAVYFAQGLNSNYTYPQDVQVTFDTTFTIPLLYSFTSDGVPCSRNGCGNFTNSVVVPLGVSVNGGSTYVFSQTQIANFDPTSMIILEDRLLGVFTDLRLQNYSVPISHQGRTDRRFFLHLSYPPQIADIPANCANQNGTIQVTEDSTITWSSCFLYDSANKLIDTFYNITGNFAFPNLDAGAYSLQFNYSNDIASTPFYLDGGAISFVMSASYLYAAVNQTINFYCQSTNATHWHWNFGDNGIINGVENPFYSYSNTGIYQVTLKCSNDYLCADSGSLTMHINFDSTFSIGSISSDEVKISNANKDVRISISNPLQSNYNYEVGDLTGQTILKGPVTSSDFIVATGNLSTGVYVVTVSNSTGRLSKKLFLP